MTPSTEKRRKHRRETTDDATRKSIKRKSQEAMLTVTRTTTKKKEIVSEGVETAVLNVRDFATETARVSARMGFVMGLPNYSSRRLEIEVCVPCYTEEIEEVTEAVTKLVKEKVSEEIDGPDLNLL